jgi:Xaa-Pro aminopeptidase
VAVYHSQDHTVLAPGMVLTLEPSVAVSPSRILVHEENTAVRETVATFLSSPQSHHMKVI